MNRRRNETEFVNNSRRSMDISSTDKLGFYTLISLAVSSASLAGIFMLTIAYFGVANKSMPAFVQLENGKIIKVAAVKDNERTPKSIKDFASVSFIKLMSWTGTLPPKNAEEIANPKPDPGVPVPNTSGEKLIVPTSAWRASFRLSQDLQNPLLKQLAKLNNKIQAQGRAQTQLEILSVGDPVQIEPGSWRVSIVANIVILRPGGEIERLECNKDINIKAIPVSQVVETGSEAEMNLSQLVAEASATGLQIYSFADMSKTEIKPKK